MSLFIGLISGTSMDGVDAALLDSSTNRLIAGATFPYPEQMREELLAFHAFKKYSPQALLQLNRRLGEIFSHAAINLLQQTEYTTSDIVAIGSHGQTIYHDPNSEIPTTLQLGCPHTIAERTGITVIADFRTRDMVVGGQGAPFAPYYHHVLFKHQKVSLVVVNVGGISNVSFIRPDLPPVGYDTGPGNVLMDAWIYKHQRLAYDKHGEWASKGQVIPDLLNTLLGDPYFKKPSPKSIDKGYYSISWLIKHLSTDAKPEDVQATLLHLTAHSIADAIKQTAPECVQVILCGGGAHNTALMNALRLYLPECLVDTTAAFLINPDYLEAMMFAWFARQTLDYQPIDLTHITGARKPTMMGAIYPKHGV